jgi:hypothetical protein
MEDDTKKLTLTGIFGSKQGEVHVGKAPKGADNPLVQIDEWSATSITCPLPEDGETASGRVTVHVNDIESNPRFLTEWRGNTSYEYLMNEPAVSSNISGNLKLAVNTTVHFRADVATYREKPGEDPKYRDLVWVYGAEDSKCSWKATGDLSILTPVKHDKLYYREQWDSEGALEVKRYGEFYMYCGLCPNIFTVPVEFDVQAQKAFQAKIEGEDWICRAVEPGRSVKLFIPPEWRNDNDPYPMAIYDNSNCKIPELHKGPTAYTAPVPFMWLSENPLILPKYTITYKRDEIPATEKTIPETDAAR